jgi:hypothetical protein
LARFAASAAARALRLGARGPLGLVGAGAGDRLRALLRQGEEVRARVGVERLRRAEPHHHPADDRVVRLGAEQREDGEPLLARARMASARAG